MDQLLNRLHFKSAVKSFWTDKRPNETGASDKRIIHCKYYKLTTKCRSARVGFLKAPGYFKCGSDISEDFVCDFVVYSERGKGWEKVFLKTDLREPQGKEIIWFDLPGDSLSYCIAIRKSAIDGWLPCYNVAFGCITFEAFGIEESVRNKRNLHTLTINESAGNNPNLHVTSLSAKYETPYYKIGFRTKSAGLDYFAADGSGNNKTAINLLCVSSLMYDYYNDYYTQGMVIDPVSSASICTFMNYFVTGETIINSNSIIYKTECEELGLSTNLIFTMDTNKISIKIQRSAKTKLYLIDSTPFRIAFSSRITPVTALGSLVKEGETGMVKCPATLYLPGYTSIRVTGDHSNIKFNSIRPIAANTIHFTAGEKPLDNGSYFIDEGEYESSICLDIGYFNETQLVENAPSMIKKAVDSYLYASLPFRADTATFSNNGNSMGAPICLDLWSDLCEVIGTESFGIHSFEFLRQTLDIHLQGAPAYASGPHYSGDHTYEDEYIMTGAAVLYGIGKYLECTKDNSLWSEYKDKIIQKILQMKQRDIDSDGIVESTIRKGVSGEHQWSTCWYDVVSYGYKDAFSNAVLYKALLMIYGVLLEQNESDLAELVLEWSDKLRVSYINTFMTPKGWFAGWKCYEGKLHDYGFLAVNGAAVTNEIIVGKDAKKLMTNLWSALLSAGFDSFDAGLPGNIFDIAYDDNSGSCGIPPMGTYQNGGITLSQSKHFINALYKVNMTEEADFILNEIAKGLLYSNVVGGTGSGVDWKTWDGVSSGYEGILCDQFGIFVPMLKRYKKS